MFHHRKRLPFALEAGDCRRRRHPRLDNLQSNLRLNGLFLLRQIHNAHSALGEDAQ